MYVLAKHRSTRRTAAKSKEQTGAPLSYTSAQRTSVYEDLVALLRGVASRWCEHWHLQLPSMMSDALNAFKNGGEVEAQTSESTYHDVPAVRGLFQLDHYIEELSRPLYSKCAPFWSRVAQGFPDSERRQASVVSLPEDVKLVVVYVFHNLDAMVAVVFRIHMFLKIVGMASN